jgi:hypothetical protein
MNRKLSDDRPKRENRFRGLAVTSLVIGILMVVLIPAMSVIDYAHAWTMTGKSTFPAWLFPFVTCVGLAGFISGIIGLKSSKKGMAVAGVILCSLVFIPYILIIYILFHGL